MAEPAIDFSEYIKSDLLETKRFIDPWFQVAEHHKILARYLMDDSIKRLIVNMPPQHGKTELITITFPAFFLGHNPDKNVIQLSYNSSQARKYSFKTREFFNQKKFQQLFQVETHPDFANTHEWRLKSFRGGLVADGVLGTVTGNPADLLIIDDPIKNREEAYSKVYREKLWDQYNTVAKTRLSGEDARIIIVLTRWHSQDIVGKIQQQEKAANVPEKKRFKVLSLPAISKDDKALWPESKSLKFLKDQRISLGETMFNSLYQQSPKAESDYLIRSSWFTVVDDIPPQPEYSVRYYDLAFKTKEHHDHTATAKLIYKAGIIYIDSVEWWKKDIPSTLQEVKRLAKFDGVNCRIGIESVGGQAGIVQMFQTDRELFPYIIEGIPTTADKVVRATAWITRVKDGLIRIKRGAWNKSFFDICEQFGPGCDIDDPIDAVSGAYSMIPYGYEVMVC